MNGDESKENLDWDVSRQRPPDFSQVKASGFLSLQAGSKGASCANSSTRTSRNSWTSIPPFEVPALERKASEPRAFFCPPIARMVEEHVWIKNLLAGHIQREDTILYPWMDRSLSTRQVGELYSAYIEVERRFGSGPA